MRMNGHSKGEMVFLYPSVIESVVKGGNKPDSVGVPSSNRNWFIRLLLAIFRYG